MFSENEENKGDKLENNTDNSNNIPSLPCLQTTINETCIYTPRGLFLTNEESNSASNIIPKTTKNSNNEYSARVNGNQPIRTSPNALPPLSRTQKRKLIFNKLYGISPEYLKKYSSAKKKKYLPLEEYQQNILNAYLSKDVDRDSYYDLNYRFRELREEAVQVEPLPPVNFSIIYKHSKTEGERNKIRSKIPLKKLLLQPEEKDEFEKEISSISKNTKKGMKQRRINKNLCLLPKNIVDILSKKLKLKI